MRNEYTVVFQTRRTDIEFNLRCLHILETNHLTSVDLVYCCVARLTVEQKAAA